MSTRDFLQDLTIDELRCAIKIGQELLLDRTSGERVKIYSVGTDFVNESWHLDYVDACIELKKMIDNNLQSDTIANKCWELSYTFVYTSELHEYIGDNK